MNEIKYPPGCKDIQGDIPNDELIRRLKKIQQAYQNLEQTSTEKYKELAVYLGSEIFIKHDNEDVQLLVACCIADIFRIYAPESPYEDPENLKNIFLFLANQLRGLKDYANTSFKRYFYLLENLECVKTFQLALELDDSQDIISALFQIVFKIINEKHTSKVQSLLFDLLIPLLNESDQLSPKTIESLLIHVIEPQKSNNKEAYNLAVNLIKKGGEHFEYYLQNYLNNVILMGKAESNVIIDKMCLIIYELNQLRPTALELALPQLEYKLKSPDSKERREYTKLLSKMFSEKDSKFAQTVPQLWEAYIERFSDGNDEIRKICVTTISDFLINHPELNEQIYEQINNRSLDTDEHIRHDLVEEILKTMKTDNSFIDDHLLNVIKDRILDIKIRIRKVALQGLAALYKKVHSKSANKELFPKVSWIPTKIMRVHFQESAEDKLVVERLLNSSIVPYSLSSQEKMIQLYYAYTTLDEYSVLSLMGIMKDRILLHQSIKAIIDILDENDASNEAKLNEHIMNIAHNLLDVSKGQELMKNLIKLFKENINLKNHFKNLVDPDCSCKKSLDLISLILSNLNTLNQSNLALAKRLIERMSSIVIDGESFDCLINLVEKKFLIVNDKNHEIDFISDDGEKGLQLINLILRIHANRLAKETIYEKFFTFLRSKKDNILVNTLKVLSTNFSNIKEKLEDVNEQNLPKLKNFIKTGTPKQAKYSIRCIQSNFSSYESILNDLYKEIINEISIQNDKTYITLLVSLGHLAFYIPNLIGSDFKPFVLNNVYKELILGQNKNESSENAKNNHSRNSKLAGKWCEEDDLPFETRAQIEGIKMATRWCLGLKQECSSLSDTLKLFLKIMRDNGDINSVVKSEPERARLRLICGTQLLKLAQEPHFKSYINSNCFQTLARLIIDLVPTVRDIFIKKLHKGLKLFKLPMQYLSIFILSALDTNRERKLRVKKIYIGLIKLIRNQYKTIKISADRSVSETNELKTRNMPENCLQFAISLLGYNYKIDSLKDEATIKQLKDCIAFFLDPLLDNPDGYQIAFIKKMLNTIKNSDDAFASAMIKAAKPSDQLKFGTNLVAINRKIGTICEIAFFHIHSKIVVPVGKEYPFVIQLNPGFFVPRETEISASEDMSESSADLERTLAAINELDQSNEQKPSTKTSSSRKRKVQQRKNDDTNEDEDEDVNDENSSITSSSLSLSNTKTRANVRSRAKKVTPNSSASSISSSSKSSPTKGKEKFETPPMSKKKKIDSPDKKAISLSSGSSREASPVIKILKPTEKDDKVVSHSEIIIRKIGADDNVGESKIEDKDDDESPVVEMKAAKTRTTRANSRNVKIETETSKKTSANGKRTIRRNKKKDESEEDEEDNEEEKIEEDEEEDAKNKEESKTDEEEKDESIKTDTQKSKDKITQKSILKKPTKTEKQTKKVDDAEGKQDDSTLSTKSSSDTGTYTLRLRNRK